MFILKQLVIAAAAYCLGSLSMSIFISKNIMNSDVRSRGSGNAGATNMARVFGLRMGLLTLFGDMAKTGAAMLIGWLFAGDWGLFTAGAACLIGHCYPASHEFRGGKGVSAGAAILLAIDWHVLAFAVAVFALAAVISRKVSLGSVGAAVTGFCAAAFLGLETPRLLLAAFTMLLVIFRHRENIVRLINGTEPDFKPAPERGRRAQPRGE